jgi:hypothetical protein
MAQHQVPRRVNSPVMNVAEVLNICGFTGEVVPLDQNWWPTVFPVGVRLQFNRKTIARWCKDGREHPTHSETSMLSTQ